MVRTSGVLGEDVRFEMTAQKLNHEVKLFIYYSIFNTHDILSLRKALLYFKGTQ